MPKAMVSKGLVCFSLLLSLSLSQGLVWGKDKPKYGPEATPLSISHDYFRKSPAPLFWSLIPYYAAQRDGRSCSLATVAMIINAARAGKKLSADEELITQDQLFQRVNDPVWKKGLGALGRGVSLDEMGSLILKSLKSYGVVPTSSEVVHFENSDSESTKNLHEALLGLEKSSRIMMVANFLQGKFTGDTDVGHFAPVGAYDSKSNKVLILDPDRQWYEPYWISEATFIQGMATRDPATSKNRGYILIKLPEQKSL